MKKFTIQDALRIAQDKMDSMSPEELEQARKEHEAAGGYRVLLEPRESDTISPEDRERLVQKLFSHS